MKKLIIIALLLGGCAQNAVVLQHDVSAQMPYGDYLGCVEKQPNYTQEQCGKHWGKK